MFHVEHHLKRAFDSNKIEYDMSTIYKLHQYVRAIIETNKKFNITGLSTEEEITNTLIIQSILP
ncbi:MAG: class I SAM-dependent methyltransferase, partial [Spirochaetes bacterium]|nr:class I SAM-dependent methyltransferase [Spirochaetota bacterium]